MYTVSFCKALHITLELKDKQPQYQTEERQAAQQVDVGVC